MFQAGVQVAETHQQGLQSILNAMNRPNPQ
jgi:hypothetical protein